MCFYRKRLLARVRSILFCCIRNTAIVGNPIAVRVGVHFDRRATVDNVLFVGVLDVKEAFSGIRIIDDKLGLNMLNQYKCLD